VSALLEQIQTKLAQLDNRERWIVSAGALFLFVTILFYGVWKPMKANNANLLQTNKVNSETLVWMQKSVQEIKQLQQSASGNSAFHGSLLSLVDSTTKTSGLAAQVKRIEPSGQDRVRVWLEQVSFDQMTDWLQTIDKQGVSIEEVSIDAEVVPGRVNARISLTGSFSE